MRIIKQDMKIHIYPSRSWYIDWYKNNRLHREDGPAEVWTTGKEYYRLNGKLYFKDSYWKKVHANY